MGVIYVHTLGNIDVSGCASMIGRFTDNPDASMIGLFTDNLGGAFPVSSPSLISVDDANPVSAKVYVAVSVASFPLSTVLGDNRFR